jgi:nucleoside 2-deoxyribosyltransferase
MNKLKNACVYLSGPIDFVDDDGVGWRRELISKTKHLNLKYLDPTNKPIGLGTEIAEEKALFKKLREEGNWLELRKYAKQIRRVDLRFCDLADFGIVYIDTSVHMCGSYNELHTMENQQKPVFGILKNGRKKAPLWLFAALRPQEMFGSIDDCVNHLSELNSGAVEMDQRWVLWSSDGRS